MTAICAMREPGRGVWVGSDTMALSCDTKQYGVKKWVIHEPWAVGVAGQLRTINLLENHKKDLLTDLRGVWDLTNRIRSLMLDDGYQPGSGGEEHGGAQLFGSSFIAAHPQGVWAIGPDLSFVYVDGDELWADGSGRAYALGAAHAAGAATAPKDRVRAALEAAICYSDGCGGAPFVHLIEGAVR